MLPLTCGWKCFQFIYPFNLQRKSDIASPSKATTNNQLVENRSNDDHDQSPMRYLADLNLLGVALIWGINIPVLKFGISEVDPFVFNAFRLTISAIVLGVCAWLEQRKHSRKTKTLGSESKELTGNQVSKTRLVLSVACFGLLAGFVYQYIFLCGIYRTSGGNTAVIMSSVPMWTAVISYFFINERLRRLAWAGLTITFVGTIIVTLAKSELNLSAAVYWGNLLILLAAIAWSTATVISRPVLKYVTPIQLAFYATAIALPFHWIVSLHKLSADAPLLVNPWIASSLVFSGLFSTGIAAAMWNLGVKQLGAAHASIYQNLIPLIAILSSWYMISEVPTWMQLVGGTMIISGLLVMRNSKARNRLPSKESAN